MKRADSPLLDHWAGRDFQILVMRPSGDLDVVYASDAADVADSNLKGKIATVLEDRIGPGFLADTGEATVISIFHRGHKVGAVCRMDDSALTEDVIREMIASAILAVEDLGGESGLALDPKETAYLKKVTEGLSDAEIADSLGLSLRAVKERKKRTLVDLNATSIAHAIAIATSAGLI